ncbi:MULTISPECIES: ImmA/IrrE family metallo-endopeptidase [unclassified Paenibacillus]|uniref:ImmA/IrrE family metallo-endopeptidase n=1 Tax=unclassified Paenibacillus TaxID=185978 RepID=UPI0030FC30C9
MNLSKYFKTPLEQTIEDYYLSWAILRPEDLTIERVSNAFNVDVHLKRIKSFSDNELYVIVINQQDERDEQRKTFFHELGHVLRHAGDQRQMSRLFRQMQEADAERFCLYSAIPFFMLEKLQLPVVEDEAAGKLAAVFQVPPEFALQRLKQIRERISNVEFMAAFTYTAATNEKPLPSAAVTEPIIRGVYGLDDLSRPHTLVIEQRGGFEWNQPLYIEVNGTFKSVDVRPASIRDGAIVRPSDLSVPLGNSGYVMIDMGRIASRYGHTANKLFLTVEDLEDAINF